MGNPPLQSCAAIHSLDEGKFPLQQKIPNRSAADAAAINIYTSSVMTNAAIFRHIRSYSWCWVWVPERRPTWTSACVQWHT